MSAWVDDVCEDMPISEQVRAVRLLGLIEEFRTIIRRTNESDRETPDRAA